ncbi:hypothetical protein LIPSTDRAFT_6280 [Lipomyces starkeyi NRRL Y-11557]|uniref:HTH CENPB-type domain-containing protein n=1 Tax=Lipomyces starkeyi NRRL Y-11557 TaxID=675824 RepID=A0A1E3PZ61_LIPST|nr:hypothetical protein LIPSTDRAFT_6280 [Lipomyces starkeyi NRRL Y-11557]
MGYNQPSKGDQSEEKIQKAIVALEKKEFPSIRSAAHHFEVFKSTLTARMAGAKSRTKSHETYQILSNVEEKTLVRWITRLTATGYPATPALLKEMAEEIYSHFYIYIFTCINVIIVNETEISLTVQKWVIQLQVEMSIFTSLQSLVD